MMFVHDSACSAVTQEENLAVNVLQQLLTKQHCFDRTYIQNYIGYLKIINYISAIAQLCSISDVLFTGGRGECQILVFYDISYILIIIRLIYRANVYVF